MNSLAQTAMQTAEEMRRQLTEKAIEDSAFRAKLVADPKGVIEEEFGVAVPDFLEIKVHESEPKVLHLSLPPSSDVELDEEQLEAIAAGLSCCL